MFCIDLRMTQFTVERRCYSIGPKHCVEPTAIFNTHAVANSMKHNICIEQYIF